ncbi:MAG: aspartyl/glutamyl-tRNA amidotransferase subunit C [Ruminococcus sp.]|nr:aspartyl/glutamyl-tRNA amidotransferase subunit C [Ruminococcus sp.]
MDLNMVQYLAKLSKLSFSDEELKSMADDMTSIIEIMDTIKEMDIKYDAMKNQNVYINDLRPEIKDDYPSFPVDVESVKKEYRNAFLNELREDVNKESFPTEKILQNATNSNDCFVVPKVVE